MPQFDISSFSSQLFWLGLIFSLLYFSVSKFIAPKAEAILTARNNLLAENIDAATEYNNRAKALEDIKEENSRLIHAEIEEMNQNALKILDRHFETEQKNIQEDIEQEYRQSLAKIQKYKDNFNATQADYCINLASLIIKKISNKEVDITILKKIYGEFQ